MWKFTIVIGLVVILESTALLVGMSLPFGTAHTWLNFKNITLIVLDNYPGHRHHTCGGFVGQGC